MAQFQKDCAELTASPHRLTGTKEYRQAAEYVRGRLEGIGADAVVVQEFPAAQTRTNRCEIQIAGGEDGGTRRLELFAIRPNGIVPPVTPEGGITGPILHAGTGRPEHYGTRSPRGCIVVLDYNSGREWLRAFRLGAKAVIFVREGDLRASESHVLSADTNLLRFYYNGSRQDLPEGAKATIHSEVVWERVAGRNVFGFFRGTDPRFAMGADEVLVAAANLDSFGEAPQISPGARGAANCAGLLAFAEHIKTNRPRRHVLVAFLDAQARGHMGSCAFYRALDKRHAKVTTEARQGYLDRERSFLTAIEKVLAQAEPLQAVAPSAVRGELTERLERKAEEHAYDLTDRLAGLREQRQALENDSPKYQEIQARIDEAEQRKDEWNDVRRALLDTKAPVAQNLRDEFDQVFDEVREDIRIRMVQLDFDEGGLDADVRLNELIGDDWICLHTSFLFGDATARWGLLIGGDSYFHSDKDNPGLYSSVQRDFLAACDGLKAGGREIGSFERASADGMLSAPRLLLTAPFLIHSGEIAGRMGIYNLALGTVQEDLSREGTPDDTLDRLDLARMASQIGEASELLGAVASEEGLSQHRSVAQERGYIWPQFSGNRAEGAMAMGKPPGSSMPTKPMTGAVVKLPPQPGARYMYQPCKSYGFDNFQVMLTDQNGCYAFGPIIDLALLPSGMALMFDSRGLPTYASTQESAIEAQTRLEMFPCRWGRVLLPPLLEILEAKPLDGMGNSLLDPSKSFFATSDGVVFWYCEDKVRSVKVFGERSQALFVNGPESLEGNYRDLIKDDQYLGDGLPTDDPWMTVDASRRFSSDLWRLNEARLAVLRSRDIMNSSIEELHGRSEDLMTAAEGTEPIEVGEALAASCGMAELPVYVDTRKTLDDLVRAVLVLLALSVPFAFALERLLIGSTNVYRQILWFVFIFTLTFLVLFFTHPAFAVSKTPIIIFLGFAVVVLSSLVIFIIMRKFEVELKVLQGLTSTVHAADVSRFGTIMAAMAMGISTMRRRPLRTALTAVTIILLTFTILCFASFGTEKGIITLFVMPTPGYSGAFMHHVNWREMNPEVQDVLMGRWGKSATVCRRYWLSPEAENQVTGPLVSREDGTEVVALRGVLGLDDRELAHREDLTELLGVQEMGERVWMTQAVAERLKVAPGDHVLIGGQRLEVGKLLDPVKVSITRDMDDSDILPVDLVELKSTTTEDMDEMVKEDPLIIQYRQNWSTLPIDSVVITGNAAAMRMGASLRAISLYTANPKAAIEAAEDLARIMPIPVSATRQDGVYRHLLGPVVEASGAKDLLFPILLGGLVIFGTMLGSVADREKEIYTFSALGLAPPHVAGLFFAEAMVYSVIGGLGGYMLAQGSLKILSVLAGYGLVRVPEMNYSSTNAVVTILIVMCTVLISAIYPAIKASRSANPGILRSWRLPSPDGDVFDIVFPFTVSEYDITGVVSFLKEHFDNYSDTGLGVFMARGTALVRRNGSLGLSSEVALAPFDLGVTQRFELSSAPSEIQGIDEVKIRLVRKSGQPKDWRRLNKVLLDDLRKQFLIWRSLPHETMEMYRHRVLAELGTSGGAARS
ncbi:MAG: hypothetical protein GXY33_09100 [Phycisphaerae bacterium]|nr:hypothetical protein [Phycisphaerae bacterium]